MRDSKGCGTGSLHESPGQTKRLEWKRRSGSVVSRNNEDRAA
jgi:hypothetical protein